MPRGRKLGTKAKKSTKSAAKSAERDARLLGMSTDQTSENNKNSVKDTKENKTYNPDSIKTSRELFDALEAKESKIILGDNIIVDKNILINHDIEIDFNGFSIVSEDNLVAARVLDIRSGKVILSGQGKVFAMGSRSVAMRVFGAISLGVPHYTDITIGKGISLYAPDSYGILISPNLGVAYGVTVKLAGKIMAHDGICVASGIHGDTQNCPHIIVEKTASIIADETTGAALEASGYGNWQIKQTCLHGAIGAIARTGILNFDNTRLLAHNGETFRVEDGAEKELKIKIVGGIYLSENSVVLGGLPEPIKKLSLSDCELYSPLDEAITPEIEACATIKDCEFESDIDGYLESLIMQESSDTPDGQAAPNNNAEVLENTKDETVSEPEIATETEDTIVTKPVEEKTTEQQSEPDVDMKLDELELLDDDDFVDEMFEFTDELDEKELEVGPETEAVEISKEVSDKQSEELKSAPKFAELTQDLESATEPVTKKKSTKKAKTSKRSKKAPKVAVLAPVIPFTAMLDVAPELTDAETDEREILLALSDDDPDLQAVAPVDMRPPVPANIDEHVAAKMALADAIAEIRKLSVDDYDTGFSGLEQALKKAEKVLAKPGVDLAAIRDAAAELLQAFDSMEQRDDSALSDAELDELFYQGAVLEEMLRPQKPITATDISTEPRLNANSDSALVQTEITKVASGTRIPQVSHIQNDIEPDFTVLSDTLNTISTLNLGKYTAASQAALLAELDRAQSTLMNLHSTQAEIDEVAANLLSQMSRLETQSIKRSVASTTVRTSSPAPIVNAILPATMIDELSPTSTWSIGVTMIDELTPFVTDATTREKMLRAMRPHFKAFMETISSPFRKLVRSVATGFKAGVRACRESLQAGNA